MPTMRNIEKIINYWTLDPRCLFSRWDFER